MPRARRKTPRTNVLRAAVATGYGGADVVRVEELGRPVPRGDEVLLRVRAAALNPLDWRLLAGRPRFVRLLTGWRRPRDPRIGRDVAGEVEVLGRNVTRFRPGAAVFGTCPGAMAEYACAAEAALVAKPASVTFEQAAALPVAGLSALQGLRDKGRIRAGHEVLVHGAAGGVGTFAVQIARSLGAAVTGVCSTRNVELVRSLGADHVVDYTHEDFTRQGRPYDLILDCVGDRSLADLSRALKPHGTLVIVGAPKQARTILGRSLEALVRSRLGTRRFALFLARRSVEDLTRLGELVATGTVTPVIERRHPLSEVAEAFRHAAGGHARGKIIVTMESGTAP